MITSGPPHSTASSCQNLAPASLHLAVMTDSIKKFHIRRRLRKEVEKNLAEYPQVSSGPDASHFYSIENTRTISFSREHPGDITASYGDSFISIPARQVYVFATNSTKDRVSSCKWQLWMGNIGPRIHHPLAQETVFTFTEELWLWKPCSSLREKDFRLWKNLKHLSADATFHWYQKEGSTYLAHHFR